MIHTCGGVETNLCVEVDVICLCFGAVDIIFDLFLYISLEVTARLVMPVMYSCV